MTREILQAIVEVYNSDLLTGEVEMTVEEMAVIMDVEIV